MVTESWLNDRTPREHRGQILGIYSIVTYVGMGAGQFLLMAGDPSGFELFSIAAMLIALAVVPVTITRTRSPELIEVVPVRVRELYDASPLGVVGAGLAGVINGSFLGMAPVFAKGEGFASSGVATLMGFTIVGGFVLQWPIGRLSDRYNRRDVMALVSLAVFACSVGIIYAAAWSQTGVIALAVLWGGLAFTIYPVAVAVVNDFVRPAQMLGASASLLLTHGVGMIVGPVVSAQLMGILGPGGLFWTIAAAALALAVFAWVRQLVGPPLEPAAASEYRVVPRNTPYAGTLDPRSTDMQLELDFGSDLEPLEDADSNATDSRNGDAR
jgi:hypothetical protein